MSCVFFSLRLFHYPPSVYLQGWRSSLSSTNHLVCFGSSSVVVMVSLFSLFSQSFSTFEIVTLVLFLQLSLLSPAPLSTAVVSAFLPFGFDFLEEVSTRYSYRGHIKWIIDPFSKLYVLTDCTGWWVITCFSFSTSFYLFAPPLHCNTVLTWRDTQWFSSLFKSRRERERGEERGMGKEWQTTHTCIAP